MQIAITVVIDLDSSTLLDGPLFSCDFYFNFKLNILWTEILTNTLFNNLFYQFDSTHHRRKAMTQYQLLTTAYDEQHEREMTIKDLDEDDFDDLQPINQK